MANAHDLREIEQDPRLFLYTSLTAGSSHIITATSRMETILKANRIPFQAIDIATDDPHRKLWQRRAQGKKLPGLVKDGFVIADLEEVEEWNEYGELKDNIGPVPASGAAVPAPIFPIVPTATAGTTDISPKPAIDTSKMVALPGAAEIKARNNPLPVSSPEKATVPETMTSAPAEKEKSIEKSIKFKGDLDNKQEQMTTTKEPEAAKEAVKESSEPVKVEEPTGRSVEEPTKAAEPAVEAMKESSGTSKPTEADTEAKVATVGPVKTEEPATEAKVPSVEAVKAEEPVTEETVPSSEPIKAEEPALEAKTAPSEPAKQVSNAEKPDATGEVTQAVETGEIDEVKDDPVDAKAHSDVATAVNEPASAPTTTSNDDVAKESDVAHQSKEDVASASIDDSHDAKLKAETQSPITEADKGVESLKIDSEKKPDSTAAAEPSGATESVQD